MKIPKTKKAEIKKEKPMILGCETALIYNRWDDKRYYTESESITIIGIHTRIKKHEEEHR